MNKEVLGTFFYWINERHSIYLKKAAGLPKPWTEDPIFQEWKFCNVFRQLDKGTIGLMDTIIRPNMYDPNLFFNIAFHRYFNHIPTSMAIGYIRDWNPEEIIEELSTRQRMGMQIFTGAYMVTGGSVAGKHRNKIELVVNDFVGPLWSNRHNIVAKTQEETWENLTQYKGWGGRGFAAYEVVTDLTYTPLLDHASDLNTWTNCGPGAIKGLKRIHERPIHREEEVGLCVDLLDMSPNYLGSHVPKLDLRAVEHSLCELEKYLRVKEGSGRCRSRYNGRG